MRDNRPVPWPWNLDISKILDDEEQNIIVWPLSVSTERQMASDLIGKKCQIYRTGDELIKDIVEGRVTICLDESGKLIDIFEEMQRP